MNDQLRSQLAKQGLGFTITPIRCPECNYLADSWEEKSRLLRRGAPCPNCKSTNATARITLDRYAEVANWLGEYAISNNRRDHASAVIMFCAFTEAILETIIDNCLEQHPDMKLQFDKNEKRTIKDVLGQNLSDLLNSAPQSVKTFAGDC